MTGRACAATKAFSAILTIPPSRRRRGGQPILAAPMILLIAATTVGAAQTAALGPPLQSTDQADLAVALTHAPQGKPTPNATQLPPSKPDPVPLARAGGPWKLALSADFHGESLDGAVWTTCYWWNADGCTNLGNHELQWYRPDNVQLAEGHLALVARPEKAIGWEGKTFDYTSGMVTTGRYDGEKPNASRFAFQYGLIEVRAKLPEGRGLWPAIWLLPDSLEPRPEIDIMEALGDSPDRLRVHLHYDGPDHDAREIGKTIDAVNLSRGWHVYGLLWEPGVIVWYLDGAEKWRYADAANIPGEPMYLLIDLAVGGDYPGPPASTTKFPARMLVDYARVWLRVPR